jgi:hypothetical protein
MLYAFFWVIQTPVNHPEESIQEVGLLFLVLEIRIWCHIPENKSIASTLAMVTEVKDIFSGKILSVLSHNVGTTDICARDEGPLQQATDL